MTRTPPAAPAGPTNLLCYGDNLAFLKQFDDESVDLIYLDPPFNSQQSYNVLFKETSGAPEARPSPCHDGGVALESSQVKHRLHRLPGQADDQHSW